MYPNQGHDPNQGAPSAPPSDNTNTAPYDPYQTAAPAYNYQTAPNPGPYPPAGYVYSQPTADGYNPHQQPPPAMYYPQQGGYAPQQVGYNPQQGGYNPQQVGYNPQLAAYPPAGPYGPAMGYPPQPDGMGKGQNDVVSPASIQPVVVVSTTTTTLGPRPIVTTQEGFCPYCNIRMEFAGFECWAIVCAILLFPWGLFCLCCGTRERCTRCGYTPS
eukprot:TRINITY_DN131_c0_g1_i1.p2 TRINITY_DN131_c0_g1~~TRINITY_DN131_c0_g1_i1.p2  ORF type:complete len:215 (+),score=16.05 TRINITY_DN131_c0_g1_i1:71-715(+)